MIRKLFVLCAMAVAATAMMAPAASAQVPVHVEGEELEMLEATTEGISVQVFAGGQWVDFLRCENHWELSISESGVVHVHDVNIFAGPVPPYTANCTGADDCGAEWDGQIFEDGTGADKVTLTFCTNRTGPGTVTCDVNGAGAEVHCNNAPVSAGVRVVGEVHLNHAISITDDV
jgi:hypothetical protein